MESVLRKEVPDTRQDLLNDISLLRVYVCMSVITMYRTYYVYYSERRAV